MKKKARIMDINSSNPIEEVIDVIQEFYDDETQSDPNTSFFQKFNDSRGCFDN